MKNLNIWYSKIKTISTTAIFSLGFATTATATDPCEDFGECKVLIEINATDGDIGFHFLLDGDDLNSARIYDPWGRKVFEEKAKGPLRHQKLTETFAESAEPLCWPDPERDEDEKIVTLKQFLRRWVDGSYLFIGKSDHGVRSFGETELTFELPAAPADVHFDGTAISWDAGDDLGNCASADELDRFVKYRHLPIHPEDVTVDRWEIVMEPDVDEGDPIGKLKYTIRIGGDLPLPGLVSVPQEYLDSLPPGIPVKVEVGAMGGEDNATFSEEDGFCVTDDGECPDED